MPKSVLTHSLDEPNQALQGITSLHDQVQIALAIADENVLKSLLITSTPPLAHHHRIGDIRSTIGIPLTSKKMVDGIIQFEDIQCLLVDTPVKTDPQTAQPNHGNFPKYNHASPTRCESEMYTLGQGMSIAQTISLIAHAGFSPEQIEDILNLPYEAWHKTWWYSLDDNGNFSAPFLRLLRTLRYADGTFTLQYKDYFSQTKPTCFKSKEQKVVVEIAPNLQSFSKTLEKINYAREHFGIDKALLICSSTSELEAQGFISQGISLYTSREFVLPVQSNCGTCTTPNCPMRGMLHSPVVMCRQFSLEGILE
jgi:hypothetical protein